MTTTALKSRPAARIVQKPDACEAVAQMRVLAEELRRYDQRKKAGRLAEKETDILVAHTSAIMQSAMVTVPKSDLGRAFLQVALYAHAFTLNGDLFMPDLIRKCCPAIYADLNAREDARLAVSLQLATRAVSQHTDPDLALIARHYLPHTLSERRDMLRACGVKGWKRA